MAKLTFPNEAEIDLSGYFLDPSDAQTEIDVFRGRFRRQRSRRRDEISSQHASIVMSEFLDLYDRAEAAAQGNVTTKNYVTGVRVILGFPDSNNSKNLSLFFEPVYMKGKKAPKGKFKGDIISALPSGQAPYLYDDIPEEFKTPSGTDYNTSVNYYNTYMRVKRYSGNNNYYRPATETDWRGDTKSMIFSFKELFTLYEKNYSTSDPSFTYSQQISAISAGFLKPDPNGSLKARYKHTLVFSAMPLAVVAPYIKSFAGLVDPDDLANLAHLCPPATNCNEVEYPLI